MRITIMHLKTWSDWQMKGKQPQWFMNLWDICLYSIFFFKLKFVFIKVYNC